MDRPVIDRDVNAVAKAHLVSRLGEIVSVATAKAKLQAAERFRGPRASESCSVCARGNFAPPRNKLGP